MTKFEIGSKFEDRVARLRRNQGHEILRFDFRTALFDLFDVTDKCFIQCKRNGRLKPEDKRKIDAFLLNNKDFRVFIAKTDERNNVVFEQIYCLIQIQMPPPIQEPPTLVTV